MATATEIGDTAHATFYIEWNIGNLPGCPKRLRGRAKAPDLALSICGERKSAPSPLLVNRPLLVKLTRATLGLRFVCDEPAAGVQME